MGTVLILPETTRDPITLIGQRAGVCWGGEDIPTANYQRGWECITSGHGRALEFVNVEMVLDGYSARVIREWYTHIGGAPTRLQASTRYIDYSDFDYVRPDSITHKLDARIEYDAAMHQIAQTVQQLVDMGIPREDAAMLLPLGMTTRVVDKRNLRNLVDMSHQRMCSRAYWEFRELFDDISGALSRYSDEWEQVTDHLFMSKCELTGECSEKHGCGRHPRKGLDSGR